MIPRQLPPAADLWDQFAYNPLTGELWRIAQRRGRYGRLFPLAVPRRMGHIDDWGYLRCDISHRSNLLLHRVIWAWVTGQDPGEMEIDHRNRIKTDNRIQNLRLATGPQNRQNCPKPERSTAPASPHKGVTYTRDRNGSPTYVIARISVNGERRYLGTFPTEEQAAAAYQQAALELHKTFARF